MTAPHVRFQVFGVPAPQGSKTKMPNGVMLEAGSATGREKQRAWRQDVRDAARRAWDGQPTITTPVALYATFVMPRPKARKRDVWCATKPDLDKILRNSADALTQSGVIRDDSLIVSVTATKVYADDVDSWTGAWFTIEPAALTAEAVA